MPPRLRAGDTVAVCAPAGPVPPEAFYEGLKVLESRYRVAYDEALLTKTGFLAGSDERRADELNRHLGNPDVRAIFCARGGYGTMRVLPHLDADALRRDPKVIIGFSDITALLAWSVAAARVRPVHGPVVTQLARVSEQDRAWLFALLEKPAVGNLVFCTGQRVGHGGGGTVEGRLCGGNLELVTRLVGTRWQLDLGASIFFAEDIDERPYRIDRMCTQLKLCGALDGVRAVALGDFVDRHPASVDGPTADDVLHERLQSFRIPGIAGCPIGHKSRNQAVPLGAACELDLASGELVLNEGAVA